MNRPILVLLLIVAGLSKIAYSQSGIGIRQDGKLKKNKQLVFFYQALKIFKVNTYSTYSTYKQKQINSNELT
jgi:hypothetical protein